MYAIDGSQPRGSREGSAYVRSCSRCALPTPVFSRSLRSAVSAGDSEAPTNPPGSANMPRWGSSSRRASSTQSRSSSSVKTTGSAVRPIGASYPAVLVACNGDVEDRGDELIDVLLGGVPGAHPADLAGVLVPDVELERALELLGRALGEHGEDRVGLDGPGDRQRVADAGRQARRHRVRVARGAAPQVVLEEREQLRRDEAHLGGEL